MKVIAAIWFSYLICDVAVDNARKNTSGRPFASIVFDDQIIGLNNICQRLEQRTVQIYRFVNI